MSKQSNRECERITRLLPDYSVGSGSSRLRAEIERHLSECPGCAQELRALENTGQLLNSMGLEPAPDSWNAIRARLEPRTAPASTSGFMWWLGRHKIQSAAAALAASIALATMMFTGPRGLVDVDTHTYLANHAAMSWSEPFADKAALGLVNAVQAEQATEESQ